MSGRRIYTRTGDTGETGLFGGGRVPKDDLRVEAYGAVDELNSVLGIVMARLDEKTAEWREPLQQIQRDCFTIGAMLATPGRESRGERGEPAERGQGRARRAPAIPELDRRRVPKLEAWIDQLDRNLPPLRSFILPGGSHVGATLHFARTVCRRAERRVVSLARQAEIDREIPKYLNRLSDLLFVLARSANARHGLPDVEWKPERE